MTEQQVTDPDTADNDFAARMTNCQFAALRCRLEKDAIGQELRELKYLRKVKASGNADPKLVKAWLGSGWNTEYLLRQTPEVFGGTLLGQAVQWGFPQAYYSVFATTLAFFKTVGHSEQSHSAVIKKFGALVVEGRYPARSMFLADGPPESTTFIGVAKSPTPSTLYLDEGDTASVETQICQFLRGTRKLDLDERKRDAGFKTKKGQKKLRLSGEDWMRLSTNEGMTSFLSLLYRKRIKSNYQDIEVFLGEKLDSEALFKDLIHVVACLNFVHEVFVAKAFGIDWVRKAIEAMPEGTRTLVGHRLKAVRNLMGDA